MRKSTRHAQRTLEVTIMFEPNRLAAEHLADAYAQLVPLRRRKVAPPTPRNIPGMEGTVSVTRPRS
ncbi:MAG: hypothetical protein ACREXR_08215 [Gammaproteobacteria bacterium]